MLGNKWNALWDIKFRFKAGHYFRANVCGDRPVAKVMRMKQSYCGYLLTINWGDGRVKYLSYKEAQSAYSVSGPIEEVCKLEGMIRVGE